MALHAKLEGLTLRRREITRPCPWTLLSPREALTSSRHRSPHSRPRLALRPDFPCSARHLTNNATELCMPWFLVVNPSIINVITYSPCWINVVFFCDEIALKNSAPEGRQRAEFGFFPSFKWDFLHFVFIVINWRDDIAMPFQAFALLG